MKDEDKTREQLVAELLGLRQQVEAAEKELSDFAYVISHELESPLHSITILANWISTDYADNLGEDGKAQVKLLLETVKRMNNIIKDILRFSRIGRFKEKKVKLRMDDIIRNVIDTISPPENIEIKIENELPPIVSERTPIMEVFENLIGNAVKYMDKPKGEIKIGCASNGDYWRFNVTDNGPGIEEKYFEGIFQLFHRLNPCAKLERAGIGLTLVKKIVEMYNGKVWVESEKGKGLSCYFTLPK